MTDKITDHTETINSKIDNIVIEYFSGVVNNLHNIKKINLKEIISNFNSMYLNIENLTNIIDESSTVDEINLKKEFAKLCDDLGITLDVDYKNTTGLYNDILIYKSNKCHSHNDQISLIKANILPSKVFYIYKPKFNAESSSDTIRISFNELKMESLEITSKECYLSYFNNPWGMLNTVVSLLDSGYKVKES